MSNYKRLFLEQYQYIFITIVTHNRNPILVENIETLKESIKNTHFKYNFDIVAIAIMPDHLHMIIKVDNINDYPKIIYSMKYYFSKYINVEKISLSESKIKKGEKGVWQRRYWEHTIRPASCCGTPGCSRRCRLPHPDAPDPHKRRCPSGDPLRCGA